jgi:hypothetical protein
MTAADDYRRLASECLLIADDFTDPNNRNLLSHMAQTWLRLAHQRDGEAPPSPVDAIGAAVVQQQQQIQPKEER